VGRPGRARDGDGARATTARGGESGGGGGGGRRRRVGRGEEAIEWKLESGTT
jgi:hypothetical protein